jgi:methylthioribose-1-phosphate isomerase
MPTDTYTKAVLTVIAACLVILVIRGTPLVGTAHADTDKVLAVDLVKVNGRSLFNSYALPVNVQEVSTQRPLAVNLKEVSGSSFYGGVLPVDIQRVSGSTVSGALPVRNR